MIRHCWLIRILQKPLRSPLSASKRLPGGRTNIEERKKLLAMKSTTRGQLIRGLRHPPHPWRGMSLPLLAKTPTGLRPCCGRVTDRGEEGYGSRAERVSQSAGLAARGDAGASSEAARRRTGQALNEERGSHTPRPTGWNERAQAKSRQRLRQFPRLRSFSPGGK